MRIFDFYDHGSRVIAAVKGEKKRFGEISLLKQLGRLILTEEGDKCL